MSRFWGIFFFNIGLGDGGGGVDIIQMQIVDAQIQAHFIFFYVNSDFAIAPIFALFCLILKVGIIFEFI